MRLVIILFSALCVAVIFAAPGLFGEEPVSEVEPPARVAPTSSATAAGVVAELTRLREEVGQNIFAGSVLDDGDTAATFESSLRTELGLPTRKDSAPDHSAIPRASSSPPRSSRVVISIRAETGRLESDTSV